MGSIQQPTRYPAEHVDPSPLSKPLKFHFSGRSAPNRFLKGAMSERLASWHPTNLEARGIPSQNLVNLYRHWGEGETGLLLSGNIMIEYDHLESPGNMIIPRDAPFSGPRFDSFKAVAQAGKSHGSLMIGQVSHPGRQVTDNVQKNPISASDIQLLKGFPGMSYAKPHAATQEEINNVVDGFAHAAEFLQKAGFDGIELHGAHGYLLSQFLSQTTNLRKDAYGGSLENRTRIIVEIAAEIHKRVPKDFILSIKLNSVEFQDKGLTTEEAKAVGSILNQHGFDFIELSGGTYESFGFKHVKESTVAREAFFIEFAELIAPALDNTKSYLTGGFHTTPAMLSALKTVDGIGLGRPLCQEPDLSAKLLSGAVNASIHPVEPLASDMMYGTPLGGAQIREISEDLMPLDVSVPANAAAFIEDLKKSIEVKAKDKEGVIYKFPKMSIEETSYPVSL